MSGGRIAGRNNYISHLVQMAEAGAKSPEAALKIAQAGLEAAHGSFEFVRDGKAVPLNEAMTSPSSERALSSGKVMGAEPPSKALVVPYEGKELTGDALAAQLQAWAEYGCMEPDAASALAAVDEKVLNLRGRVFVVLGATSALGPMQHLLAWGATVIGVARRKPSSWAGLIAAARASAGTFIFPLVRTRARTNFPRTRSVYTLMHSTGSTNAPLH